MRITFLTSITPLMPDISNDAILDNLHRKITTFSDIHIRDIVREALAKSTVRTNDNVPQEILDIKESWLEAGFNDLSKDQKIAKINHTLNSFKKFFKDQGLSAETLDTSAPFAVNMRENHFDEYLQNTMFSFCDYISILSTKSAALQASNLDIFPPKDPAQMQCTGGSATRIHQCITKLSNSPSEALLLEAHANVIDQFIANKARHYIPAGNEIHLLPFLSYCLGVEEKSKLEQSDPLLTIPRPDMPAWVMNDFLHHYGDNFKEAFLLTLDEKSDSLLPQIQADAQAISNACKAYDLQDVLCGAKDAHDAPLSQIISDTVGANYATLIEENEQSECGYQWSDEAMINLAIQKSFLIFPDLPRDQTLDTHTKIPLFAANTLSNITSSLESKDVNQQFKGIESLWTISHGFAGNSTHQSLGIMEELTAKDSFPARKDITPHQLYKINDIENAFEQHRNAFGNRSNLASLLQGNADLETITSAVNALGATALREHLLDNDAFAGVICKNIFHRPDNVELISLFSEKLDFNEASHDGHTRFPTLFLWHLIKYATHANDVDFTRHLLEKFPRQADPSSYLLITNIILQEGLTKPDCALLNLLLEDPDNIIINQKIDPMLCVASAAHYGNAKAISIMKDACNITKHDFNRLDANGNSTAFYAANKGHHNVLKEILECGVTIEEMCQPNANGITILHYAVDHQDLSLINFLMKQDISDDILSQKGPRENSLMHLAANAGNVDILKIFMKRKDLFPLEERNAEGYTALHLASFSDNEALIREILLEDDVKDDQLLANLTFTEHVNEDTSFEILPLENAASRGNLHSFQALLDVTHIPNQEKLNDLLGSATFSRNVDIVNILLAKGANPFDKKVQGGSLISHVITRNADNILGAFIDTIPAENRDIFNQLVTPFFSPLQQSIAHNHDTCTQVLIDKGIDINYKSDIEGTAPSPLALALEAENDFAATLLIKKGANIHDVITDNDSGIETPLLHYITQNPSTHLHHLNTIIRYRDDLHQPNSPSHPFNFQEILDYIPKIDLYQTDKYGDDMMWTAITSGKKDIIQILLDNGYEKEQFNQHIFRITENGDIPALETLLDFGADINLQDQNGNTSLIIAVHKNNKAFIELLLDKDANVHLQNKDGYCPLHGATFNGDPDIMGLLLEYATDVNIQNASNETPLYCAVVKGSNKKIFDIGKQLQIPSNDYWELLHHKDVLLALKERRNLSSNFINIIDQLCKKGADQTLRNHEQESCLDIACFHQNIEIVDALIANRTSNDVLYALDPQGNSPLHEATDNGNAELLKLFTRAGRGFSLDAVDEENKTALFVAVKNQNYDAIKTLVDAGANIISDKYQDSPLILAAEINDVESLKLLLTPKNKEKINHQYPDAKGKTVLHKATALGGERMKSVIFLLRQGADVSLTDDDGFTAYDFLDDDKQEMMKMVIQTLKPLTLNESTPLPLMLTQGAQASPVKKNGSKEI